MSQRRVLVAHPSVELYGSDRVMLESIEGFVAAGWQVLVTVPDTGPLVAEIVCRGARVVYCPTPVLRKSALRPIGFLRLLADAAKGVVSGAWLLRRTRPDAIYVSTLTLPGWLLLGRLSGYRILCHVHEAEGSASTLVRKLLTLPLFAAHTIIANSDFSRQVLTGAFESLGARATVVYNGVPPPAAMTATRNRIVGPVRLAYVGRLSERKGVDVAVSAVAKLRERGTPAELDIVGAVFPGYEWYEARLVDQVNRLGLDQQVHLRGFENPMWPRLANADIALVPSRADEPFGNTAVEAVLAGRPAIISNTSGLREASCGFESVIRVPPGNPGCIADAVESMLRRWPDYHHLALADAVVAARRYAPARYQARIGSLLAQMIGG